METVPTLLASAHHYSLDFFVKPEVLVSFDNAYEQETIRITSDNAAVVEFEMNTDRNTYLDLQGLELKVQATIRRSNNTDLRLAADNTNIHADDSIAFTNNALHSLFSNCDVILINEFVHSSNNLYAQ